MDAFDAVYRAYGRSVHGYLARLTGNRSVAEELCQETFLRYLRHRPQLEGGNGAVGAWLYKVATNLACDLARRRGTEALGHEPRARDGDGAAVAEARDLSERIQQEIDELPQELRAVFLLRAHHNLTHRHVAAALKISERTAKERFRRAREILAHRLEDQL